jgi:hypothetical protein
MRLRLTAPSRHFDAAQQPRGFSSKADINFGASSYRVYEYTAWLSWPARIIPHTWEIRTRCSMGSRNFSRDSSGAEPDRTLATILFTTPRPCA